MKVPPASVIVRSKNEERGIERTLRSLRCQTVSVEIIVVDSGSTDRTRELAQPWCDLLIDLPAEEFSFGKALNLGAFASKAPVHFALSAHCWPEHADWIERALAHYQRADVAGAYGDRSLPGGEPLETVFYQHAAHARANPHWGFTNHASSWRASAWEQFPFSETIEAAEDKEWARRVLEAGWVIAVDPHLWVDMSHVWRAGVLPYYRRQRRVARALRSVGHLPPYGVRDLLSDWWSEAGADQRSPRRRRLSPMRTAGLIGQYLGQRKDRQS